MALKPVPVVAGLEKEAERAVREIVNDLIAEINLLKRQAAITAQQTKNYNAREREIVRARGDLGLTVNLPRSRTENQGDEISILLEIPGSLRVTATASTINALSAITLTQIGLTTYQSNGNGGWFCTTAGQGTAGAQGEPGAQGLTGATGTSGVPGQAIPGDQGEQGPQGDQGPPGGKGDKGDRGDPGPQGDQGPQGDDGPPGRDGTIGRDGTPGAPGEQGDKGDQGDPGAAGVAGSAGSNGVVTQGITLTASTQSLEIVTTSTATTHGVESFKSVTAGSGTEVSQQQLITTATTTTAVSSPAVGTAHVLMDMSVQNVDALLNQTVTIQKNSAGFPFILWGPISLGPGERVEYTVDMGWRVFDSRGREKSASGASANTILQPGQQLGLQVTAGVAGPAVPLSGAEQEANRTIGIVTQVWTVQQDNLAFPVGVTCIRATFAADIVLTGLVLPSGNRDGGVVTILNRGSAAILCLGNNAGSTVGNRFIFSNNSDLIIDTGESATFVYETATSQWTVQSLSQKQYVYALSGSENVGWSATTNNFALTSAGSVKVRVLLSGNQILTGMVQRAGNKDGEIITFDNIDSVDSLIITNQDTLSTAANRFLLPGTAPLIIGPGASASFHYDNTTDRWRLTASSVPYFDSDYVQITDDFTGGLENSAGSMGESGWGIRSSIDAGSGVTFIAGELNHPGIMRMTSGPTAGALCSMARCTGFFSAGLPADGTTIEWVIRVNTITTVTVLLGWMQDQLSSTGGTDSLGIYFDSATSANWKIICRAAAVSTFDDTGIAVVAGRWYRMTVQRLSSTSYSLHVESSADDAVTFNTGTNVPTTALRMAALCRSGAAANRTTDFDYWSWQGTVDRTA